MSRRQSGSHGFSIIELLLILLVLLALGFGGWYVWHKDKKDTSDKKTTTAASTKKSSGKKSAVDPTADWTAYSSAEGQFSLKYPRTWVTATHPELCSPGILLLGADASSVGVCASESFGQVAITWRRDGTACEALDAASWTVSATEAVTVSATAGTKTTATARASDAPVGALPEGTSRVQYCFAASNGTTLTAAYTQLAAYPDALSDFNLLVTRTLRFE